MLFTCGQFLFGFRGCLLTRSKQPLSEPSGEFKSFHLGSGRRFVLPRLGAKSGRDFSRNIPQLEKKRVKDGRGDRARREEGRKKEASQSQRRVDVRCRERERDWPVGVRAPHGTRAGTDRCPSQPEGVPLGGMGARAARGWGCEPGLGSGSPSSRAVTFSVRLARAPLHCTRPGPPPRAPAGGARSAGQRGSSSCWPYPCPDRFCTSAMR